MEANTVVAITPEPGEPGDHQEWQLWCVGAPLQRHQCFPYDDVPAADKGKPSGAIFSWAIMTTGRHFLKRGSSFHVYLG